MEFRFINNNAPLDRHSQKLVRNHAMKGKNLGRIITARGHNRQQRQNRILPDSLMTEPKRPTEESGDDKRRPLLPKLTHSNTTLPHNPFSGAELAYFTVSVPLMSSVRYLFYEFHHDVSKELYPQVFCHQSKENETTWFERVIEDPCVFHCAMAVTRARISCSQGRGGKSVESTRHFLLALRQLNQDLGVNSTPKDSSIVVAISLAIYANLNNSTDESRIHLQGLKRMLEMRPGGLAALFLIFPEVGNKIRRADLELALLAGTPTLFGLQPLALPTTPYVVPLEVRKTRVALPDPLYETSQVIQFAMTDVLALCTYAGKAQLSAFQYQDLVMSIFQRLVDYAPLCGERPPRLLDEVCQLGLLAFMNTVLNHTSKSRTPCSTLLSDLLWTCLDKFEDEMPNGQAGRYFSLQFWLIFIYALSAPEHNECCVALSPTVQHVQALADSLKLKTWEDVAAHLNIYPWVAAFHDEPSKRLWAVICH